MTLVWKIAKRIVFVLITILLIVVSFGNPVLRDDARIPDHFVRYTGISVQTHPAHAKIVWSKQTLDLDTTTDATVHQHITETLLKKRVEEVAQDNVSPMHKIMLLMGCYGDRWDHDFSEMLSKDFLVTTGKTTNKDLAQSFFANFMLQALDDRSREQMVSGEQWSMNNHSNHQLYAHDRSICNCLRDFAAPMLMTVIEKEYKHDSCSVQRLLDYAVDGAGSVSDGSVAANTKLLPVTLSSVNDMPVRSMIDPMLQEIQSYETLLGDTSQLLTTKGKLNSFVDAYCNSVGWNVDVTVKTIKCPLSWQNKATVKVSDVITGMKQMIKYMHAHNKLRTPDYSTTLTDFKTNPVTMQKQSFEKYMSKYNAAYHTCARVGVPQYTTEVSAYTKPAYWYCEGELVLLLAATISMAFAVFFEDTRADKDIPEDRDICGLSLKLWSFLLLGALVFGLVLCIAIQGGIWQAKKNFLQDANSMPFLILVFVLWLVLAAILTAAFATLCGSIFYKREEYYRPVGNATASPAVLKTICRAQITADLPVILGLTLMAVATTLQRQVADYYLILTVIVLFLVLGVIVHISNVFRLLHLRSQDKSITYNRVLIGFIIAAILYMFVNLAGLDVLQGQAFVPDQQVAFAIVAFVIYTCGDLSLEFLCLFKGQEYADKQELLEESLVHKYKYTSYFILAGVFFLQYHQRLYLCPRMYATEKGWYCNALF